MSGNGWSSAKSADLYNVRGWGEPYFIVNEEGNVEVRPDPERHQRIDLLALTKDLKARGLALPLLIRFPDILKDRIQRLNQCFAKAISEYSYAGVYRGVYPIKVNPQRHVVEEIIKFGRPWSFGLEVGSKPELLIALAAMDDVGGLILCNGYKDQKYIETALLAQRVDKTIIFVLERIEELELVFRASEKTGIIPILGVRAKLTSKGVGRWADSTGDRAKFGLIASEIVEVVDRLAEKNMLSSMQLLHFHMGSQISSIIPIKNAMREAATLYVELAKMGCHMRYLDVGGGLAVDYDGSKTDFHASKNYNMQEYAYDVVSSVQEACTRASIDVPTLVTETGRAIVAHQSILIFEIVGSYGVRAGEPQPPSPNAHPILKTLYETYQGIMPKNLQESLHDALQAKEELQSLFKFGYVRLRERAEAERTFWGCCEKIIKVMRNQKFIPEELKNLEKELSSIYYSNFSVFQSAPDIWAIKQLFPIMPIHRLQEEPSLRATLVDLTCDSDGAINHFIDREDVKGLLEVHPYRKGEPYYMGLFLNGAYQEILGDLHNLFGDTNVIHVQLGPEGYQVAHVVKGDSIAEVLHYVQYLPDHMIETVRQQAERSHRRGQTTLPQMRLLMQHYEKSFGIYTYLTEEE
ncbi:arginine decarboxylase [Pajaroellobacter abortibovis]|uniref:Biosynthetic arginine decarboxylase n=1 Tax=Pajaroellobacter abortibovis TaxID=1882918 RepID=A0A1L6MZE0_9BACT|nr:arginine decarboxylase [Pajaroellobacter abortibovis]